MSLEHKSTNYHYSKKKLENKSYNVNFIILEYHLFLRKHFLHGKSVSWKRLSLFFFFFENLFFLIKKHFWHIWEMPLKTFLKRNILKKLWKKVFSKTFENNFCLLIFLMFRPFFREQIFYFYFLKGQFSEKQ